MSLSLPAKIALICFFLFFIFEALVHIIPFLWVLNNSVKTTEEFYESSVALTKTWSFSNYKDVFSQFKVKGSVGYLSMFTNSIWQTGVYLFINLLSSFLVAYAISKYRFPGRGVFFSIMIFTQTIPIIGTGAAAYKLKYALGMINNPATIWLSWAMGFDYSAFILYGTFQSVSNSYFESAKIDGANNWQIMFKIMLPLALPCIAALAVTNFVSMWNNYAVSQITLNKYPNLAYGLYLFQSSGSNYIANPKGVYFAALVLTALPGIILYSCFQNLIINNITVGGIKG